MSSFDEAFKRDSFKIQRVKCIFGMYVYFLEAQVEVEEDTFGLTGTYNEIVDVDLLQTVLLKMWTDAIEISVETNIILKRILNRIRLGNSSSKTIR